MGGELQTVQVDRLYAFARHLNRKWMRHGGRPVELARDLVTADLSMSASTVAYYGQLLERLGYVRRDYFGGDQAQGAKSHRYTTHAQDRSPVFGSNTAESARRRYAGRYATLAAGAKPPIGWRHDNGKRYGTLWTRGQAWFDLFGEGVPDMASFAKHLVQRATAKVIRIDWPVLGSLRRPVFRFFGRESVPTTALTSLRSLEPYRRRTAPVESGDGCAVDRRNPPLPYPPPREGKPPSDAKPSRSRRSGQQERSGGLRRLRDVLPEVMAGIGTVSEPQA